MIEAVEAPRVFIPEKIRRLAMAAKTTSARINQRFAFPDIRTFFIDPSLQNINGNMIIAEITELMNKRVIGETFERIF